jgi:MFS transporter, DHA3 family, macrolide efflux protein
MMYETPPNGFRTFVILWITQSLSVFGSALTFFAINIWVVQVLYPRPDQQAQLAFALSAISLAFALPTLFIAPIAGAWADRHDRKRIMLAADGLNGVVSIVLLLLIVTQLLNLWLLLVLMVLFAVTNTFHGAAFDTSYAMLVPESQLPRANGMMQTIWSLSGIFSPPMAAMIIGIPALARQGTITGPVADTLARLRDGTALAISVDIFTFLLAVIVLLFLHIPSPKRTDLKAEDGKPAKSLWADVKEGALYIWNRRPMLWLLGTFTVINFVSAPLGVLDPSLCALP